MNSVRGTGYGLRGGCADRSLSTLLGPPERSEGGRFLPAEERGGEVGGNRSNQKNSSRGLAIAPYLRPYSGRRYLPPAYPAGGPRQRVPSSRPLARGLKSTSSSSRGTKYEVRGTC